MALTCGECGAVVGENAKFCAECGARLPSTTEPTDVRKTVTALFCDVVGSTSLGERTDPENMRAVLGRYFAAMRQAIERHGGTVEKFIGDAVVAFFGVPTTREDDALRAVRAAFDMLDALGGLNPELSERWGIALEVRIGVNTGEVLVTGSGEHTVGDAVNVAARLEQAAGPGEVLVGETTWRLIRQWAEADPLASLEVKGKEKPVAAWKVRSVAGVTELPQAKASLRARLVGRDRELALLRQSLERATVDRSCQLFTLFGVAGAGKSRLTAEFLASVTPEVRILPSRCLSYGEGTSLWPLLEMLRAAVGLSGGEDGAEGRTRLLETYGDNADARQVVELLAPLAGLGGTPAAIEEVQWAVRRFIEALARSGPVIWVVEDIHWAEPAMLTIVEDLVDWTRESPVLVLCLARPEFLDDRPSWGGGKLNVTNVLLKSLSPAESAELIQDLLGGSGLSKDATERLVSGAGGTPLFLEQLLAMLVDDGLLHHDTDGWHVTGDIEVVSVPPSIGALLTARLERLSPGERQVLEAASVVGHVFYAGAAAELTALDPAVVNGHLRSLTRKEMIRSERSDIAGEEGFAFSHTLVRDSAYQVVPKLRRAELHERLARWLDKRSDSLSGEADDFVGHHLAEAAALRRDLGELDDGTSSLAEEAATRLSAGAGRLMATDVTSAAAMYARAAELVPGTPLFLDLRLRHGMAEFRAQQYASSRAILDEVVAQAEDSGDAGLWWRARLMWLNVATHTEGELSMTEVATAVESALEYFESTGDDEGLALCYAARTTEHNIGARWAAVAESSQKLFEHAKRCGDHYLVEFARGQIYAGFAYGELPARQVLDLLTQEAEGETTRNSYGIRRAIEGVLLAYDDRPSEARASLLDARAAFEEVHNPYMLLALAFLSAEAHIVLGDEAEAERQLRYMIDELDRVGERSFLSTAAPWAADLALRQGEIDEARRLAELGRSLALEEDVASQAMWRIVAAKLAATAGDDDALAFADEAVEWMGRSDQLSWLARILVGRAEVQLAASDRTGATASLQRAVELFDQKGDIPEGRRTRALLDSVRAS